MVPLVSSFLLSTKEGKKAWVEPVIDASAPDGYRFVVKTGTVTKAEEERLKAGTKTSRGSNFSCVLTGAAIEGDHIKSEGVAGRMGARLMTVVASGNRSRFYLDPASEHEELAKSETPTWVPDGELPDDHRNFWAVQYGLTTYASLFTSRQLVTLTTFSDLVADAREKVMLHATEAGLSSDTTRLHAGGIGAAAYLNHPLIFIS